MNDWKRQLEGLNRDLVKQENDEQQRKLDVLGAFRKRLLDLEPVVKSCVEFGDAFGVDCDWEINRFDDRYPYLTFLIHRPRLEYRVECRNGVLSESVRQAAEPPKAVQIRLEQLGVRSFEQRLTEWVRTAAEANRKTPGKRT